jgi:hypothetical protein
MNKACSMSLFSIQASIMLNWYQLACRIWGM